MGSRMAQRTTNIAERVLGLRGLEFRDYSTYPGGPGSTSNEILTLNPESCPLPHNSLIHMGFPEISGPFFGVPILPLMRSACSIFRV